MLRTETMKARSWTARRSLLWVTALLIAAAACDSASDSTVPADVVTPSDAAGTADATSDASPDGGADVAVEPPGLVRFVQVSDLHYAGSVDDPRRSYLQERVARINAVEPQPHMVVVTGDLIDGLALELNDPAIFGPLHIVAEELDALAAPWIAVIGNHEHYDTFEPDLTMTANREARWDVFETVLAQTMPQSTVVDGVRLVTLNSMSGPTWDQNAGLIGSFADEELAWLDTTLADGRPTLLFFHHPPNTLGASPNGVTLCDVLSGHPGVVKGLFTGHLHGFWRGEYCEVPYWVVGDWRNEEASYFLVEYDGADDVLTILNEESLPFPSVPEVECSPGETPLTNHAAAEGTFQRFVVENASADATGLAQYLGEALGEVPMVMSVDAWDGEAETFEARLTVADRWTEDGFLGYLEGAPCVPFDLRLDDPCLTAGPAAIRVDLLVFLSTVLEVSLDPAWQLRLDIEDLRVAGRMGESDGVPYIEEAVLTARIISTTAVSDLRQVLVTEYCAENLAGCVPGADDEHPPCPAEPGPELFDEIPTSCDMDIEDFSVRGILQMLSSVPETVGVVGELRTEILPAAAEPTSGHVDEGLFATDAGRNCAAGR